jgi:hypothetical protein
MGTSSRLPSFKNLALLLVLALWATGCASNDASSGGKDTVPAGDLGETQDLTAAEDQLADYGAPVEQLVGPTGGTVDGPGAVVLEVPANAMTEEITLEVAVVAAEPEEETLDTVGPVVEFGPAGTTFETPVTVTLPYDEDAVGGPANEAKVKLWWAATVEGPWEALESTVDTTANVVTAQVSHFSFGVAGLLACVPHCGGNLCGDDGCGGSCGTCEGKDDACIEGRCIPQGTPTDGPLWGHLGKDDLYFDFEGGTATSDPNRQDLSFEHTAIMGDWWISTLAMEGVFLSPDSDGVRDFGLFSTVESADGLDLQPLNHAPEAGFVYVLKTNLDKLVKVQIMKTNFKLGDEGAPSVDFIYMYDNFVDTLPPAPRFVRVLGQNFDQGSGAPQELGRADFAAETPEVVVTEAPGYLDIHFGEAIDLPTDASQVYDRGVLEVRRIDQEGFAAQLAFSSFNQDHFNRAFTPVLNNSFEMISEPGTYELRALPLGDGQTGYFKDHSDNNLTTWPAVVRIIYNAPL